MSSAFLSFSSRRQPQPVSPLLLSNDVRDALAAQAGLVLEKLSKRFARSMSDAEFVLVFVHYLYGAVTTVLHDAEPGEWLGLLHELASRFLRSVDVACAIHATPPDTGTPIGRVLRSAEQFGRSDAEAILASLRRTSDGGSPDTLNQPVRPER